VEFFEGFKWAVPLAFADAVALCRFEEGDILYDAREAYDRDWRIGQTHANGSLQVRYPNRVTGTGSQDVSRIFSRNWNSKVKLDLYEHHGKTGVVRIETTQGRLYTALWKGDLRFLERDSSAPQIPSGVMQATRHLSEASEAARGLSLGYPIFGMARDLSNAVSRDKYQKILAMLKKHLLAEPTLLHPQAAGFRDWKTITPTVDIAFFPVNGLSRAELHDLIKQVVYRPAKDAKNASFRLSAHGAIF
jgi:hypothetical protein